MDTIDTPSTMEDRLSEMVFDIAQLKRRTNYVARGIDRNNKIINCAFRTNQDGYVSGTNIPIGAYALDGWKASGVVNLDPNPRFEAATTGWTAVSSTGTAAVATRVTTRNHSATGNASMSVAGGSLDGWVQKAYTVVVGKTYNFSVWVYLTAAGTFTNAGRCVLLIDSLGGGQVTVTPDQTKLNQWQRISGTMVMTSTSFTPRLYGYQANSSAIFYDDVQVTEGPVLYPEFSGVDTDCSWSGAVDASASANVPNFGTVTNLIANPNGGNLTSNATMIQNWTTDGGALGGIAGLADAISGVYNQGRAIKSIPGSGSTGGFFYSGGANGSATPVPSALPQLVPGQQYTLSMYVKSSAARSFLLNARTFNASNTTLSTYTTSSIALAAGTWQRVSITFTADATTTYMYFFFYIASGTWNGTDFVEVSAAMLTLGNTLIDPFDGAKPAASSLAFTWTGTANNSPSTQSFSTTLTGAFDPNFGSLFTINTNGRVSQIVERSRVPAGTYIAVNGGTATMRVYNNTLAPGSRPAFAAGPVPFTADGTDDVVVEFSGGAAGATIGQVRMFAGTTDFGFSLPSIGDELRDCFRYYFRQTTPASGAAWLLGLGQQQSTTLGACPWRFPVRMRTNPTIITSGTMTWTDMVNFSVAVTSVITGGGIQPLETDLVWLQAAFAANGASLRPGTIRGGSAGAYIAADARIR